MRFLSLAPIAVLLASCASMDEARPMVDRSTSEWRAAATAHDKMRLRDWRKAFTAALAQARAAGHEADIAKEGRLLEPDAALGGVPIPNGNYRCRVIKVGSKTPGMLDYIAYPYFSCRIDQEENRQGFAKLTGSQRQVGIIFANDQLRQVFLGTLVLGDENRAMQYGRDTDRDVAGFVEQHAPGRWRLVMPYPAFESTMDVLELVPAS